VGKNMTNSNNKLVSLFSNILNDLTSILLDCYVIF
jgi:hypothetical protein